MKHGVGTMELRHEGYTYEGNWENDMYHGYGKLRLLNASHATWQQIRAPDGAVRDEFTIVKSLQKQKAEG